MLAQNHIPYQKDLIETKSKSGSYTKKLSLDIFY